MTLVHDQLRNLVRYSRRQRGRIQLRDVQVTGVAPRAVMTAIESAMRNAPQGQEKLWVDQIERLRSLLAGSVQALQIEDFGAGPSHAFDNGEFHTVHTQTRTVGRMTTFSKPSHWAYLLFRLVRELRPESVVELGSCVGISACYLASALELNGIGRLVTLEGAQPLAERSTRSLEELGLTHRASVRAGRFTDTLDDALGDLRPVAMAFVDGHHIEQATLDYAEQILDAACDEAVLVFDDINWSDGMRAAWRSITADPRFALTVDLRSIGIAVVSRSATSRHNLQIAYG
ncbi:MAG TPA: class I SAM-dependent methyltransferase [Propionibacteriaceae bacterium]|nr:class I SAM-dependent methyltransferase [Propionibacteriaceae bacterium]